jgi:hypothetical protein
MTTAYCNYHHFIVPFRSVHSFTREIPYLTSPFQLKHIHFPACGHHLKIELGIENSNEEVK